ncbi:MAG TPA: hypothetical protein VID27_02060 [Blastocatellia bacterium]|jgi:hypothetical protein
MASDSFINSPLWKEFKKAARRRRRDPVRLMTNYMRECMEIWEDEKLMKEMRRDARRSGLKEANAVEVVRRHRLEKKKQRAAS